MVSNLASAMTEEINDHSTGNNIDWNLLRLRCCGGHLLQACVGALGRNRNWLLHEKAQQRGAPLQTHTGAAECRPRTLAAPQAARQRAEDAYAQRPVADPAVAHRRTPALV